MPHATRTVGSDSKAQDRHDEQEGEENKTKHKSASYSPLAQKLTFHIHQVKKSDAEKTDKFNRQK